MSKKSTTSSRQKHVAAHQTSNQVHNPSQQQDTTTVANGEVATATKRVRLSNSTTTTPGANIQRAQENSTEMIAQSDGKQRPTVAADINDGQCRLVNDADNQQQQQQQRQSTTLIVSNNSNKSAAAAAATTTTNPISNVKSTTTLISSNNHVDKQAASAGGNGQQVKQQSASSHVNICAACLKPIKERYLLMALEKKWHEDCLKCACCDCRLGEVGSSLFTHSDKILCRRDFLRIFGQNGFCAACRQTIPPYELVMRANENAYHMNCFACQHCQYRFCVGDRFHLTEMHKIICILCFSEHQQRQQQQQQSQLSTSSSSSTATTIATSNQTASQQQQPTSNNIDLMSLPSSSLLNQEQQQLAAAAATTVVHPDSEFTAAAAVNDVDEIPIEHSTTSQDHHQTTIENHQPMETRKMTKQTTTAAALQQQQACVM